MLRNLVVDNGHIAVLDLVAAPEGRYLVTLPGREGIGPDVDVAGATAFQQF